MWKAGGGVVLAERKIHSGMKRQRDVGEQRRIRRRNGIKVGQSWMSPRGIKYLSWRMCRIWFTMWENLSVWMTFAVLGSESVVHIQLLLKTLGSISARRDCMISDLFAMLLSFPMADITTAAACSKSSRCSKSMFFFINAMSIRVSQQL